VTGHRSRGRTKKENGRGLFYDFVETMVGFEFLQDCGEHWRLTEKSGALMENEFLNHVTQWWAVSSCILLQPHALSVAVPFISEAVANDGVANKLMVTNNGVIYH